ncbi:MAG: Cytosol aminopeptidase [Chlamydiae bacterium]|nr:Cytosol aminopeptidase [Chlamydiota bacterium]
MLFFTQENTRSRKPADALVIPFWQTKDEKIECAHKIDSKLLQRYLTLEDFKAKKGQIHVVFVDDIVEKRAILVGLGKQEECDSEALRMSYSKVILSAISKKHIYLNVLFPKCKKCKPQTVIPACIEGMMLANYLFEYKKPSKDKKLVQKLFLLGISKSYLTKAKEIAKLSESVCFARDLVNSNAEVVNSDYLAKVAKDLGKLPKVKTTILEKAQIKKENMGLFLAVNQGSKFPPYLLIVEYKGNPKSKDVTVLVGKGVTYDTGGLSIKTSTGMVEMKLDMSGAASVLGTIRALCHLKSKRNVIAVVATTDNAIGPNSYRPGDVYTGCNGKTVEVTNTDAEGRLTLADAIAYSCKKLNPTRIINIATLTGSMVIALGEYIAGVMGNDDKLIQKLLNASKTTHERLWALPLPSDYLEDLKSDIADLKNSASRWGSGLKAGLFLKEFVDPKVKWAHIDIAGPAFIPKRMGYVPKGGTGFGVRLLVELIQSL